MKQATIHLKSETKIQFGKFHLTPKHEKELPDAYEKRTWREKAHFDKNDNIIIPAGMITNCIKNSAQFMSVQIPGKGKSTYTKHFKAGFIIYDHIITKYKKPDLYSEVLLVPSNGQSGSSSRVLKAFPTLDDWEGSTTIYILDDIITADILERVIRNAGTLIGVGTYRPINGGTNGRFSLVDMDWREK